MITTLLLLLLATVQAEVLHLNAAQFLKLKKKHKHILVMFSMEGCKHCKQFAPIFEDLAQHFHDTKTEVPLVKIDQASSGELKAKYKIKKYPSVVMAQNNVGMNVHFTGERNKENLVKFVDTQVNKYNYQEIDSQEVERLSLGRDKNFVIMSAPRDSKAWKILRKMSNLVKSKKINFYVHQVEKGQVAKMALFWKGQPIKTLENPQTLAEAQLFRKVGKLDDVVQIRSDNFNEVEASSYIAPTLVAILSNKQLAQDYQVLQQFKKAVGQNIVVSYIKSSERNLRQIWNEDSGVTIEGVFFTIPNIFFYKYFPVPMEGELSLDSLMTGYKMLKGNTLPPIMKSNPIPQDPHPFAPDVVGLTFDQEIKNCDRHIVVLRYTPGCGMSKKFMPHYKELAERMSLLLPELKFVTYDDKGNNQLAEFTYWPNFMYKAPGQPLKNLKLDEHDIDGLIQKLLDNETLNKDLPFEQAIEYMDQENMYKESKQNKMASDLNILIGKQEKKEDL